MINIQTRIQQLLAQVKSLTERGKFAGATKLAEKMIMLDRKSAAEAYYISASTPSTSTRDPSYNSRSYSVKAQLEKAIEIDPLHAKARMALARLYFPTPATPFNRLEKDQKTLEKDWKRFIQEYTEIIEIDPDYSEAYEHRAYLYNESGQRNLAMADFSKAINLSPDSVRLHLIRGKIYLEDKNYSGVLGDLRKILSLDPKNPDAIHLLESTLSQKTDFLDKNSIEEIIKKYEENIDINNTDVNFTHQVLPPLANLYKRFGLILAKSGDYEQAIDKYTKSNQYQDKIPFQKDGGVHYLLGNAYSNLNQYKKAISEYDKTLRIEPSHSSANEGRSNALLKIIEKHESDFQEKVEGFLSGPNSIFELQDRFLEREKECSNRYRTITNWIAFSLSLTFLTIILGIGFSGWWIYQTSDFSSVDRNTFFLLPYFAVVLLFVSVPIWWTRILLKSRDRWQVLQEDCFRKAAIMQYIQATGGDKQFRNQIILETIKHMANRSGSDLLLALHSDDPGMLYSVTDIMDKILKKKSENR